VLAASVLFLPLLIAAALESRLAFLTLVLSSPVAVLLARFNAYVELTPLGLGIHGLSGMTTVPWGFIDSVDYVIKGNIQYVTVRDVSENRARALSAPRVVFGVGRWEATEACTLIEQWWLEHRGATPPVETRPIDW
jgi:hypothetical protein